MSLKQIKEFFKTYEFDNENVRLNEATVVTNPKRFYESHIKILEAQSGKKAYLPYYNRLKIFYYIIKNR
jgi:hypothetical protein